MFERFTDRARRSIVRAQEEARGLSHNYIGTEHILLAILAERSGIAAQALESLNVGHDAAREQVREIVGEGSQEAAGPIPFAPRAKKVLELSLREALNLKSDYIGTEHLLLGLTAEGEGVALVVLEHLGAPAGTVRERVLELIGTTAASSGGDPDPSAEASVSSWPPRTVRVHLGEISQVRDLLSSIDGRLAAIERHLGIASEPEGATPPPPESPSGEAPPGEAPSSEAPSGEAPPTAAE
jgi:ATP-dependent Clp protease ATP-binding subunit ClpC